MPAVDTDGAGPKTSPVTPGATRKQWMRWGGPWMGWYTRISMCEVSWLTVDVLNGRDVDVCDLSGRYGDPLEVAEREPALLASLK